MRAERSRSYLSHSLIVSFRFRSYHWFSLSMSILFLSHEYASCHFFWLLFSLFYFSQRMLFVCFRSHFSSTSLNDILFLQEWNISRELNLYLFWLRCFFHSRKQSQIHFSDFLYQSLHSLCCTSRNYFSLLVMSCTLLFFFNNNCCFFWMIFSTTMSNWNRILTVVFKCILARFLRRRLILFHASLFALRRNRSSTVLTLLCQTRWDSFISIAL